MYHELEHVSSTTMSYDESCNYHNALYYCYKDPQLYLICILYLLFAAFYLYRLLLVLYNTIVTKKFRQLWPQIVFWFCLTFSPILSFLNYFIFNIYDSEVQFVFLLHCRHFSNMFPYITLSVVVMQIGIAVSPSAEKKKKMNRVFICLGIYILLFWAAVIFRLVKIPFYEQFQDLFILLGQYISYLIFIIVSIPMLDELHRVGIHDLPQNFFFKLTVGLHLVTILNIIYAVTSAGWWGWHDLSGLSYTKMSRYGYRRMMLFFQMINDLVGSAFPNLILAFGIIYMNKTPQFSYAQID